MLEKWRAARQEEFEDVKLFLKKTGERSTTVLTGFVHGMEARRKTKDMRA